MGNGIEKMTKDFIQEQKFLTKNQIGTSTTIRKSPEISALRDLALRIKSPNFQSQKNTRYLKKVKLNKRTPIIIVAGGTDPFTEKAQSKYQTLLMEAFHDFTGTIISGGTTAGVCGLVGDVQVIHKDRIKTIGYLPAKFSEKEQIDTRYREIRKTDGETFSIKEPLQYWTDILASGISPNDVKLIGIGGGDISAAEYRIALLLGAKVGILENSGRAAADLLKDPEWNTAENLIILPQDGATIRAFVGFGAGFRNHKEREELAQQIHEEYRRMQLANPQTNPSSASLVPWEDLDSGLKDSNRNQADQIFVKLRENGYKLRKAKQANPFNVSFTSEEIEHLAELEHGRWNAERLLAGWKPGPVKGVVNKISPYIIPWENLMEEMKEWDRDPVRKLPEMLAKMRYEIYR